jgi:hypothetical protein
VAYTATPFANILMHDARTAGEYGADLFPATFIISLTAPDDYFGPTAVFGSNDDDGNDGLPIVRPVDQAGENWIPDRHDKAHQPLHQGKATVPPSLGKAIDVFLLSCAARAVRGQDKEHHSMLVHVSRFVDVHECVYKQVSKYLDVTRSFIAGGDKPTINRLRGLWENDFVPTTGAIMPTVFGRQIGPIAWADVLAKIADTSDKIRVVVTNGKSKTGLDYDAYKGEGLSVIAIGGDKLSRGLTLEGLSVSYFLRVAKQYDSLLQMGRWFGYRRGFADLCRLYTTPDMADWFTHVATANQELRSDLAYMQLMLQTPKEYGLRVAGHSIMAVTAQNKQRYAADCKVGFSGEGKIETVLFRDPAIVEQNARVAEALLEELGSGVRNPPRPGGTSRAKGELWTHVPGQVVANFIRNFSFPPENVDIVGSRLAAYVDAQLAMGELTRWTILFATGDETEVRLAGRTLNTVQRTPGITSTPTRFIVRSILNRPDEAIDLDDAEFADALRQTNYKRRLGGKADDDIPSGPSIREVRGQRPQRGLLIIYAIDPVQAGIKTELPLIGLVFSFPTSQQALQRLYVENTVRQRGNAP